MPTQSAPLATLQARTIRKAQSAGRTLSAWSASLADGTTLVVYAATDTAARQVAVSAGPVLRVGPAAVRDMTAAIERALQAAPVATARPTVATAPAKRTARTPERRETDRAFEREFAALLADEARENAARAERVYWLTGEGSRPALPASDAATVAGTPRFALTARPRPGVGAPFVGDGSKSRPDQHARVAHEYVPARTVTLEWHPRA